MIDRTRLTEVLEWWVELVADLEPDTETFTVTMSRAMAERTLAAIDQLLDFPTDEQAEALFNDLRKVRAALVAVRDTMIGDTDEISDAEAEARFEMRLQEGDH